MAGGMPVLGQDNMFEILGEIIDEGNDLIGIGHGEISAGTKIILYVNDEKHFCFLRSA